MTVWGFFAVVVSCLVGAWLYLRRRVEVVSVDESRRVAMEQARVDAADAFVQRQRTSAHIAAEGEAKAQAEKVATAGAADTAAHLSGDLQAQADAVASIVGASPPRRNETAPTFPPPGRPK